MCPKSHFIWQKPWVTAVEMQVKNVSSLKLGQLLQMLNLLFTYTERPELPRQRQTHNVRACTYTHTHTPFPLYSLRKWPQMQMLLLLFLAGSVVYSCKEKSMCYARPNPCSPLFQPKSVKVTCVKEVGGSDPPGKAMTWVFTSTSLAQWEMHVHKNETPYVESFFMCPLFDLLTWAPQEL